jgi:SAM-dependent methyltransferase
VEDDMSHGDARVRQCHYYAEESDPEFEITRPHGCGRLYEFLIGEKLGTGLDLLGIDIAGLRLLEVCCGSGMMSEALVRQGARVTGLDVSAAAVGRAQERCRRFGFAARFLVGDAERLPFADGAFDVVAVHDGLHHLDDPQHALREMARVSGRGVLVLEPARALVTRLAVQLGLATDVEEAGNVVRRLAAREVATCLRREGFRRVKARRTLMYYPHQPFGWFRWFDRRALFALFLVAFSGLNWLVGRWGNKLALGATRERLPAAGTD